MRHWTSEITATGWFWYVVVPLVSVVLAILFQILSKRNDEDVGLVDLFVSNEIGIQGWGVNLGFLASSMPDVSAETVSTFLVVNIAQTMLLAINAAFLRYCGWHILLRLLVSYTFGLAALISAFIVWRW